MTTIHHNTRKATDISLAKRQISPASHRAVLAGEITLRAARDLGRDRGPDDSGRASGGHGRARTGARSASAGGGQGRRDVPPQPVSRISKDDRTPTKTPCLCGCSAPVPKLFAPGHDMRMFRVAREHLAEGRELSDEQREYLESSGKMERVRAKLADEDARRRTSEAQKTTRKGNL